MKAVYSMVNEIPELSCSELTPYNYDSRYKALISGFKFVHLFESKINNSEIVEYEYYSTMKL